MKKIVIIFFCLWVVYLIFFFGLHCNLDGFYFLISSLFKKEKQPEYMTFNFDDSEFMILSGQNGKFNLIKEGKNYETDLSSEKWSAYFALNLKLTSNGTGYIALNDKIIILDMHNKTIKQKMFLNSDVIFDFSNKKIIVFDSGNIIIFDGKFKKLFEKKITEDTDNSSNYPNRFIRPIKIAYSEKYNSVYYTAYTDLEKKIPGIFEMSLNDFSVKFIGNGKCPQVDEDGNLCYIDYNSIFRYDHKKRRNEKIFEYTDALWYMKVFSDIIFFAHGSSPNIKGVRFPDFKVYHNGKIKYLKTDGNIYRGALDISRGDRAMTGTEVE